MNALHLSSEQSSLLSQIELCINAAKQLQLDRPVELSTDLTGQTQLWIDDCNQQFDFKSFSELSDTDLLTTAIHIAVAPSDMTVLEAQQNVAQYPNLVLLNVNTGCGLLDIWQFESNSRALYYTHKGEPDFHHAMLLTALAFEFPLEDALTLARANVSRETWPTEKNDFPTPILPGTRLAQSLGWQSNITYPETFLTTDESKLGLYPVVDSVEWVEKLLAMGVTTLQLRIKDPDEPNLESKIERSIQLGHRYGAQLYINDYWQLSIKHGAYGVHLGQEDLEVADMQAISTAGLRLGLSTHGYYEILRISQLNPSYIALGHIFPTTTKEMPSKPQGLSRLTCYRQLIRTYPTVAIGGIDLSRAEEVWKTGVSSLAVVRAVTKSSNAQQAIQQFKQIMRQTPQLAFRGGSNDAAD